MALDKLVDSAQLDADLTTVANAIRTKGGTSAALSFPDGMADAIAAIQTGGGGSTPENWRFVAFTVPSNTATVTLPVEGTPGVVCIDAGVDRIPEYVDVGGFMLTRYTVCYTRYNGGGFAGGRCTGTAKNGNLEHYSATGSTYNAEGSTITIKSVSNVVFAHGHQYTLCYSLLNS